MPKHGDRTIPVMEQKLREREREGKASHDLPRASFRITFVATIPNSLALSAHITTFHSSAFLSENFLPFSPSLSSLAKSLGSHFRSKFWLHLTGFVTKLHVIV